MRNFLCSWFSYQWFIFLIKSFSHYPATILIATSKFILLISWWCQIRWAWWYSACLCHYIPVLKIFLTIFVCHHACSDCLNLIPRWSIFGLCKILMKVLCWHYCFNWVLREYARSMAVNTLLTSPDCKIKRRCNSFEFYWILFIYYMVPSSSQWRFLKGYMRTLD